MEESMVCSLFAVSRLEAISLSKQLSGALYINLEFRESLSKAIKGFIIYVEFSP